VTLATPVTEWRAAADMLADTLLVWLFRSSPLDSQLPVRVLPRNPEGLRSFLVAEKAFARASWDSAYGGYDAAAALDPTCALCFWRQAEVARFYPVLPRGTGDVKEYRARLSEFPPNYQTLILAEMVPLDQRLDSLDALARRAPEFLFAPFRWGDELMHRGPLVGRPRLGASVGFIKAKEIRSNFAPAWEHLAWLMIAEGNEQDARVALDTLAALPPPGQAGSIMRDLMLAAYAWRFLPAEQAQRRTDLLLAAAAGHSDEPLDAGARYLNHFGAPKGAVWLGARLEALGYRKSSAMLAQVFGNLSAGRAEQAHQVLARAVAQYGDESLELLDREIDAVLLMFDRDSAAAAAQWGDVDAHLRELAQRLPASLRPRATWMRALLARRFGGVPPTMTPDAPAPLAQLLEAYEATASGRFSEAVAQSESLRRLPVEAVGDPFLRTVLETVPLGWTDAAVAAGVGLAGFAAARLSGQRWMRRIAGAE
jgi:hypothetical protein